MDYSYFHKESSDLTTGNKVNVKLLGDSGEVFYEIAKEMVETIKENNTAGKRTVFIIPVGPVGQYPIFNRLVAEDEVSLSSCYFINMDEYLDDEKQYLPLDHKLSFRGFMEDCVYSQIPEHLSVPVAQRIFPDPNDPTKVQNLIDTLGGVDIAFGGIGINGHLAFNEPQESLSVEKFSKLETRALEISSETRVANAIGNLNGAIDAMPRFAVTLGMRQILGARKIRLGVFRAWHQAVLRQTLFGEISTHFPATLLQSHPDALIYSNNVACQRPF
ncbi:MAG TPA: glucosamine-6-phosphate isomerase [Sphaerochaeta sp.]|nr:glucosamine-6-phosphate isomerase [Sphaerochaeta sp.]